MERVTDPSPSSLYDSFSPSVEIHAAWTGPESDDAAINNAYDILGIREEPVRDTLGCNQEHTTSSASYLEHFNDSQPGSSAGMPVSKHCSTRFEVPNEDNEYYPYANEADFTAAAWFYTRELSKGDVTDFFEQRAFDQWHSTLSFTNSSEWLDSLHQIPYGIRGDEWSTAKIAIPRDANDSEPTEYTFYYRNVMKAIKFLIRHEPFKDNLTYAPVRAYASKDQARRMYNELHTGDWWWETQKQLPRGATIIPLLLGTDKTLLTMLHGDQSVWPIYLTIGNLDAATRRSQLKPSTVLLGFIPILEKKKGSFELRSAIWHGAMERVLLRTFSVSLHS